MWMLNMLIIIVCTLLSVAFYTLMERKLIGIMQNRKGPNKTSIIGIIQPISDAIKLLSKETSINQKSNMVIFMLSPALNLICSMMMWITYPTIFEFKFMKMSSLFLISCMAFNTLTIMMMSWSSNSNYAFIGMMRTISQLISYEINFMLTIILMMNLTNQINIKMMWTIQVYYPIALIMAPTMVMWLIIILAETNRTPFDFSEGESELVSGFNIEYSSSSFIFLFLAEYTSIMLMSILTSSMFSSVGMTSLNFYLFYLMLCFYFIWTRATFPRFRYDKLMKLNWIQILPTASYLLYISFAVKMY
uniref:NADH-ubiquinone oxidoreductase chain 1 n=1 Tax=Aleurocanthus camelliae TaxID=1000661 RepID=A0A1S5RSC1_ALECM|nr:NADH dehydrogenase subunit 1 [Aleurocanthus camelliae]